MNSQTYRSKTWQPWGFAAVSREAVETYGDSRNFFVNPNHVQATDLGNTGENPEVPLATIDAAVTLCRAYSGDTIYIMSNDGWQYGSATQNPILETVVIPATKPGIKLVGVGTGALGVYWYPENADEVALTVNAIDVTVENICFSAPLGGDGIYAEWDGVTAWGENLTVRNCAFVDLDIGIQMEYTWHCEIDNCKFTGCAEYGIYTDVAGSGASYCKIHDCGFSECDAAMTLLGGCDYNHIFKNSIYNSNAQSAAVATDEGIVTTGGDGNQVYDNWFSCLLPVPANGDWDDLNTAAATDAWVGNHCLDGLAVTNPT